MNLIQFIENRIGVQVLTRSDSGKSICFVCPECGKPKAYIYKDYPFSVICFSYGEHIRTNLYGLYAMIHGVSYVQARDAVKLSLSLNEVKDYQQQKTTDTLKASIPLGWKKIQQFDNLPHVTYLKSRGLTWENVKLANIHWHENEHFVLFPVYEKMEVVSFEKRCIVPKKQWKGRYIKTMAPEGVRNNSFLYGIDWVPHRSHVFLCEGIPNWFSLYNAGMFPLSMFGSSPTERQIELLMEIRSVKITIACDGDLAGINAIGKISSFLKRKNFSSPIDYWIIPGGKDLNDVREDIWNSYYVREDSLIRSLMDVKIKHSKNNKKRENYGYNSGSFGLSDR